VLVLWQGHAIATDGRPYDNRYCWIMRVEHGTITEVTAFFDAPTLADLFERVSAE
jgi:ketosteroid isomerase-like protein